MNVLSKRMLFISVIVIIFVILASIVSWMLYKQINQIQPTPSATLTVSSTVPASTSSETGIKTYKNTEFGFEFKYPSDLIVRENTFKSYYSKFNLQVERWNKEDKYLSVFDVNVVLPEFANRTFIDSGSTTSTVMVDGISGIRYEYKFEGLPEVAIVLPTGQYKAIIGIGGSAKFYGYENIFYQILTTFKFIK